MNIGNVVPSTVPPCHFWLLIAGSIDRIIDHLKLAFIAEKPPPPCVSEQVALMAAEERAEYF